MTSADGNNPVVARHLEALANAAKDYTLAKLANISSGSGGSANVGVLDTVSSTVDGGFWYELVDNVPCLKLRKGNYEYSFKIDGKITFVGDANDAPVAYLPFITTLDDACGNAWTSFGKPAVQDDTLYLNGSSYLYNSDISASIGSDPWTIDFWANCTSNADYNSFFGTFNVLNSDIGRWICVLWNSGNPMLNFANDDTTISLSLKLNERHHYALTYDSSNIRFFVDGSLKQTLSRSVQLGGNFYIGLRPYQDGDAYFHGYIDHFRIHKSVLWTSDFTPPTNADYV